MPFVGPATSHNTIVQQVYPIVNEVYRQMTGLSDIQAIDTNSLVAMGTRLQNMGKLDMYLNTLARRIGMTIDSWRVYNSRYRTIAKTNLQWGAYVQKLSAEMPEAVDDLTFEIGHMDGQSVDQYIINNPKVRQKIFEKDAAYSFFITMSTKMLRDAFLGAAQMDSFINMIFGMVQNKINLVMEELGRLCVNNFILNLKNDQHYHLVSMYNAETGNNIAPGGAGLMNNEFLRWMVSTVNMISDQMAGMGVLYNAEGRQKFTPKNMQMSYMLSMVQNRMKTVVYYDAYNKDEVALRSDTNIPFFQQQVTLNDPDYFAKSTKIMGTVENEAGVKVEKTLENCVGVLFDTDAMGTFRQEEEVLTTPVNARARYYNTFWHERQMWFNDMDENGVAFFLD